MKKRFFAAVLAVILLLSVAPAAYADTIVNLGSTPCGAFYDQSITDSVPVFAKTLDVDEESVLPAGLKLVMEYNGLVRNFYLRGTPTDVGTYNFKLRATYLDTTYDVIEYTLTVSTPAPVVTAGANVSCSQGESAAVSVSVSNVGDGSAVTYQWYRSTVNSNVDGAVITGANSASLGVDTSVVGTSYYYCYVANNIGGQTVGAVSSPIAVTVAPATVTAISVATLPNKTVYAVGESLNTAGLAINVVYSNGMTEIRNDVTVPATRFTVVGTQAVTVTYQGKQTSFNVTVADDKVVQIGLTRMPNKTEYIVGETLDTTGMELKVETATGYELVTTGFKCNPTTFAFPGTQTVTVTYQEATCSFKVNVKEDNTLSSISVTKTPDKMEYVVGEALDTTGMEITAKYGGNSTGTVLTSGYTCEPSVFTQAGKRQMVTVKYEDKTCVFMVTVSEAAPEVSPEAPETADSEEAAPSPTVPPVVTPVKKAKNNSAIVIAIIICAILALSVAGAYVYVMYKNKGKLKKKPEEPEAKDFYDPDEFKK